MAKTPYKYAAIARDLLIKHMEPLWGEVTMLFDWDGIDYAFYLGGGEGEWVFHIPDEVRKPLADEGYFLEPVNSSVAALYRI